MRACHSCPQHPKCMFHQPKLGGFKNNDRYETKGRHNIGYQLLTDKTNQNAAAVNFMSCEMFTETMLDRMRQGRDLREQGLDGEVIRIHAQEGDPIKQTLRVGFNSRGEVVRPMAVHIEPLEAAGYKINHQDQVALEFRKVTIVIPVPVYTLPSMTNDPTAQDVMDDIMAAEADDDALESAIFEARRAPDPDEEQPKPRRGRPRKEPEAEPPLAKEVTE